MYLLKSMFDDPKYYYVSKSEKVLEDKLKELILSEMGEITVEIDISSLDSLDDYSIPYSRIHLDSFVSADFTCVSKEVRLKFVPHVVHHFEIVEVEEI